MPGQFNYKSLADAMVVVYHSWTESHHYVDQLITRNDTILFTNPSQHPIGEYPLQGQRRFHIENLFEALVPNTFCFVNETKTIYLMTNGSYDPRKVQIITSVKDIVLSIASNNSRTPVEDIIIDNVCIRHGSWRIDRYELAEAASAAFLTSSFAVMIDNATSIVLSDIEISHTGSYGLRIKEGTSNIAFINSLITDTGAGGVWVGHRTAQDLPIANKNKILSNEISYGGNEFPCAVGILVHRAVNIIIGDNEVHHHRYIGISVGSQSGYLPVWTSHILIQGNYVHDIGQHILCDQGGIYILGIQPGTMVHGNVVKNVFSYSMQMWGIYLDDGASEIVVSNNVVYNTGWAALYQHYGANNRIINNVFARASLIQPPHLLDRFPDGDVHIGLTENHTSWTYTCNIVYDTFLGANHSAFKSDNTNVSAIFNNNVYYSTHDISLLFGSAQVSFADWQQTGQDNNSVVADPLFAGDVNQCDFFTVQANSPAAKLGFVNITKLSKWTLGCETNSETVYKQFYHW